MAFYKIPITYVFVFNWIKILKSTFKAWGLSTTNRPIESYNNKKAEFTERACLVPSFEKLSSLIEFESAKSQEFVNKIQLKSIEPNN